MEYIYGTMLLHSAGQKVSEDTLKKVLKAAGIKVDPSRVKAVVSSLEGVDIEDAIKNAAFAAPAASGGVSASSAPSAEASSDEEEEEEEEVSEEDAVEGLGALFG